MLEVGFKQSRIRETPHITRTVFHAYFPPRANNNSSSTDGHLRHQRRRRNRTGPASGLIGGGSSQNNQHQASSHRDDHERLLHQFETRLSARTRRVVCPGRRNPDDFRPGERKARDLKIHPSLSFECSASVILWLCLSSFAHGQSPAVGFTNPPAADAVVLPKSVPDPIEPFNRAMWSFNKGLMTGVIKPTSRVYRFVVVKPVRTGIGNFGRNLTYPGRLINNLLQGKWSGARDESYRFVCNTTVGVAGFFDVGTKWKISKSDADFGQTFGQWGWKPQCFIMLPLFGPSNERDTLGFAADTAANPLIYIAPYKFEANKPLTYLGPYTYFNYAVMYNDLSDSVGEYVRFSQAEMDPYSEIQYAWTFARENRVADFQVKGEQDKASLETLESVFFTYKDPEFPGHGRTRSVRIPATGKELKFTFWLQPGKSSVVYIVPGLGSHRLAQPAIALAELVYKNGFSAVCISSAFNSEFMEHASTAAMPAYLPVDGHDVHVALTEIDQYLNKLYPDRLGDKALMGYSMGALHSLFVAATGPTNQLPAAPKLDEGGLIQFDRYVAINTPVRLLHGISKLDEFYRAPLEWPVTNQTDNLENTFLKVAALSKSTLTPQTSLPFNAIESRFLIGLSFRLILRDIIFSSQRRNNQGVLQHPIRNFRREPVYQEILHYSYRDYFEKFAIPYYWAHGLDSTAEAMEKAGDLRTYDAALRANPNIRIIVNQNDFLLADEDLAWLHATFTPEQLTVFEQGGHLGNLFNPAVQKTILEALSGLQAAPSKATTLPSAKN
ncbi:MAG: VacJ family lipoprotein [Verrucomicrobia bacterium]|nr:VacJ family lipoprotein [Verrucomicrobiota bacterium]